MTVHVTPKVKVKLSVRLQLSPYNLYPVPQTLLAQDLLLQTLHLAAEPRVLTLQLLVLSNLRAT